MRLKKVQQNWEKLAQADPLYGVLSHPDKRGRRWDEAEFFATGREEITALMERARALGADLGGAQALDFGCGVGRLSQALALHFGQVTGVDISPTMLEKARLANQFGGKVQYVLNEAPDLRQFADGTFNLVYSNIVLQHLAPQDALAYILEFARLCRPGGWVVFQYPLQRQDAWMKRALKLLLPAALLRLYRLFRYGSSALDVDVEMNGAPESLVRQALESGGATLVARQEELYWARR